jgi:uncharacterized protein YdeI (YjbR/CyaY-like superfamily)
MSIYSRMRSKHSVVRVPLVKPTFFTTPAAFRKWLERHAHKTTELLVGFHKSDSGKASITWAESVDEALCFGWIDGVRKRVDDAKRLQTLIELSQEGKCVPQFVRRPAK